jgi:hypothetical protein
MLSWSGWRTLKRRLGLTKDQKKQQALKEFIAELAGEKEKIQVSITYYQSLLKEFEADGS